MLFEGVFLRDPVAKIRVCMSGCSLEPQINAPVLPPLTWCCMKNPDNKIIGRTLGRADISKHSVCQQCHVHECSKDCGRGCSVTEILDVKVQGRKCF